MVFPKPYVSQPVALATYAYTDIAAGTGTVVYYGARMEVREGADVPTWHLLTNAVGSSGIAADRKINTAGVPDVEKLFTFDAAPFNMPQTAKGTAYLSADLRREGSNPVYASGSQIFKVSGLDETPISTAANTQWVAAGSSTERILMPMTLTQTHFKIGDYLRFKVYMAPTETTEGMPVDPLDTTYLPMKILIPFKLQL